MVNLLSYEMSNMSERNKAMFTDQLLEVITSGMYDEPLMIYREYIQNCVDAIDSAVTSGLIGSEDGKVRIDFKGRTRTVLIEDNGQGVDNETAERLLRSIGLSSKNSERQRGFRGIGRLGGLAYCDLVRFETKSSDDNRVAVVDWDSRELRRILENGRASRSLSSTVRKISNFRFREVEPDDPDHFFRVHLINIHPFHEGNIAFPKAVRNYLCQVAPVPFNEDTFSYAKRINTSLADVFEFNSYNIEINGTKLFRPYTDDIEVNKQTFVPIKGIELFDLKNNDGSSLGRGWYAVTDLKGALPDSCLARSVRVRQGNIEVGDQHFLDDFFTERRFSAWHIGELYIDDHRLIQNARRDGFEQSPEYERFVEQAIVLCRFLSRQCREASRERNHTHRVEQGISQLESAVNSASFFIDSQHLEEALELIDERRIEISGMMAENHVPKELVDRFNLAISRIDGFQESAVLLDGKVDGRSLRSYKKKELLLGLCRSIMHNYDQCASAEELLKKALSTYTKDLET